MSQLSNPQTTSKSVHSLVPQFFPKSAHLDFMFFSVPLSLALCFSVPNTSDLQNSLWPPSQCSQ